jgi:streptomycin 6-kinase
MGTASLRMAAQSALAGRWPGAALVALRPLEGGRSGITMIGELVGAEVDSVVIKAAPEGRPPVGRHDVLRQARVLVGLAAAPGVVVPEVLATGTEPVHFFAMTRLAGEAVEPVLDAAAVRLDPGLVTRRAMVAARMLAALHAIDRIPALAGCAEEPAADLATEVRRWRATADAADPDILVGGRHLADLLEKAMPVEPVEPALVHGDYRLGNIVFDGARATGLIDWEIWARTDPGVDLGWLLAFCDPELFPGIGQPVDGLPTAEALFACYLDAGGRRIAHRAWYEAFGCFKMAAIMAHNLRRHREGRHVDPFQETLRPTIARLVEAGTDKFGG